jgi:hypothetical protein
MAGAGGARAVVENGRAAAKGTRGGSPVGENKQPKASGFAEMRGEIPQREDVVWWSLTKRGRENDAADRATRESMKIPLG